MKLFNATYYHGSGANFDEFDFKFMSSGEGAQVHGWGVYLAENKSTGESYRESSSASIDYSITVDDETFRKFDDAVDYIADCANEELHYNLNNITDNRYWDMKMRIRSVFNESNYSNPVGELKDNLQFYTDMHNKGKVSDDNYKRISDEINAIIKYISNATVKTNYRSGMLATVHVDDDAVLVDELDIVQNCDVKDILINTWKELSHKPSNAEIEYEIDKILKDKLTDSPDSYLFDLKIIPMLEKNELKELAEWFAKYKWGFDDYTPDMNTALSIANECYRTYQNLMDDSNTLPNNCYFYHYYDLLTYGNSAEEVSLALLRNGLDGIKYEGHKDGNCIVLINLDKCKIIAKE